jgi:hypothetical protein
LVGKSGQHRFVLILWERPAGDGAGVVLDLVLVAEPGQRDRAQVMGLGLIAGTTDDVAAVLGRAPRTFEDYVVRAAAAACGGDDTPAANQRLP